MTKALFFMHLSPPIHGVTVCNDMILNSSLIKSSITTRFLPIRYSNTIEGMQSNGIRKIVIMMALFFRLLYELIFHRPNIVYFTISPLGTAFLRDIIFVVILKVFRVKVIYHLHGKGINLVSNKVIKYLYRFTFNNSNVVCISELLAKDIEGVSANSNVIICPNGIALDNQDRNKIISRKHQIKDGGVINVLFLSNLSRVKGVDLYLNTVSEILRKTKNIKFHLAGPFSGVFTRKDYDMFLQENPHVQGALSYHGAIYDNEKWSLLSQMDILLHPTRNDAFPLVILEAMAVGCSVLSTNQGGIPDMLKGLEGSKVIDELNFTPALFNLIEKKSLLVDYTRESFSKFDSNFTAEKFEENILEIVCECSKGI